MTAHAPAAALARIEAALDRLDAAQQRLQASRLDAARDMVNLEVRHEKLRDAAEATLADLDTLLREAKA